MTKLGSFLIFCLPLLAAVDGVVTNRTTGGPQADTAVTLYQFGQGGMEAFDQTKTDAQGRFSFAKEPSAPGPRMVRVEIDGVTYNKMMPPGTPTTGLAMDVYRATPQPGAARVSKHMLLFQPANGQMTVNETFLVKNNSKTTWFDPKNGTIRFFLPQGVKDVDAKATAPDGVPIPVPTGTEKAGSNAVKFEIKPGETRIDLSYTAPYTEGAKYAGKIPSTDENTYLIAPQGVTLAGQHLSDLGIEPRTQAHLYGLAGTAYEIALTGTAAAADQPDSSGPGIEQILPRVNSRAPWIVAIALGILGLGFVLLYRKETHERGSR